MTKRKINIVLIILTIVFLLASCSVSPPEAPKTEYDYDHVSVNLKGDFIKESSLSYKELEKIIEEPNKYPDANMLIVKKIESYSYYWLTEGKDFYTDQTAEKELVWTVSRFEIVDALRVGKHNESKYTVGAEFKIVELWGETPNGEFLDLKNNYFYELSLTEGQVTYDRIYYSNQRPQINECYFVYCLTSNEDSKVVFGEWGEPIITEGTPIDMLPVIHPYGYVPDELVDNNCFTYWFFEFTEEAYKESNEYIELHHQDENANIEEMRYHNFVVNAWEDYGHIVESDKKENNDNTTIIFIIGFSAIFLCIIAVGIILAKRSKSTPKGTPPMVAQNSPDVQDTHDTPVEEAKTASPPDVTEPPGPPKEK